MSRHSKVIAQTDTQTDTGSLKTITFPYTRTVKISSSALKHILANSIGVIIVIMPFIKALMVSYSEFYNFVKCVSISAFKQKRRLTPFCVNRKVE